LGRTIEGRTYRKGTSLRVSPTGQDILSRHFEDVVACGRRHILGMKATYSIVPTFPAGLEIGRLSGLSAGHMLSVSIATRRRRGPGRGWPTDSPRLGARGMKHVTQ
jgi:hypothetical protein